jgi:GAF domain-containing protein
LHETALDLAAQRALPDLLQAIVARAVDLLKAKGGVIYLYRPASDDLELTLTYNLKPDFTGIVLNRGDGLSGQVLETGRPMAVDDYGCWEGRSVQYEEAGFTAVVAVPISWGNRLLGVLDLLDDAPRTFSPADVALLERFTPLAAAALEQTRLLEEERARWREAETLREAGAAVTETLSLDERLRRILEQLDRVVPYDSASVQLLRDDYLEIVGGRGLSETETVIGLKIPIPGDNPNTAVVVGRKPIILADAKIAYPPFRRPPNDYIRSWLGVPLIVRDQMIGMLAVDSVELGHFNAEHVRLVAPFANQAAIAIENARLYEGSQRRLREMNSLLEISQNVISTLELDEVLRRVINAASPG